MERKVERNKAREQSITYSGYEKSENNFAKVLNFGKVYFTEMPLIKRAAFFLA